ncbi:hypothetical protein C4D60_Mb07t22980 [Musa balbisiana]|uniref:Uncharacterized protein n=1 Tax=Musa balbisiana TaxID=52838 RepID=A0A4S8JIL4_MUSBA|nr:hypothetical protein C4D60_Mb07t22980 [Musa balbisiana]
MLVHFGCHWVGHRYHGSLSIEVSQVKTAFSIHGCIIELYVSWHGLVMVERNFVDEEANWQSLAQSSMDNKRHLQIGAAIIQATKHHDLLTESNSKKNLALCLTKLHFLPKALAIFHWVKSLGYPFLAPDGLKAWLLGTKLVSAV